MNIPMILSKFVYNYEDTTGGKDVSNINISTADMYSTVERGQSINLAATLVIATTILMMLYIFLLLIFWFIDRRNLVANFTGDKIKLFKIATLGKGDAEELTPGMMLTVTLIGLLVLLSVLGGFYFDIVLEIFSILFSVIKEII